MVPSLPHGPDGMNDAACRQIKARAKLCFTGATPIQGATIIQQHRTGSRMNSAIHPAAAQQAGIGRINNGVYLQCCYICTDNFNHGKTL